MQNKKNFLRSYFIIIILSHPMLYSFYVVGLIQVKNEADIIEYALRALALHTDAIIILDDASEDNTIEVVKELAKELNIIEILANNKSEWVYGSEVTNRQKLLDVGRKHKGTHFIEIDADEIFTTHCAENQWLRKKLFSLKKGQILQIPLINLWKSFEFYRSKFTDNFPDICYCTIGYCDDGISDLSYNLRFSHANFLHFGRFPARYPEEYPLFVYESDINHSLLHLPFINWENVIIKKTWIIMLEIVRLQEKLYNKKRFPKGRTINDVSNFYQSFHNYESKEVTLKPTPLSWLNYSFFKEEPYYKKIAHAKLNEIYKWIDTYGYEYFAECEYLREHLPILIPHLTQQKDGI